MVLTIKNFSNPVWPWVVETAPTNLVWVAGTLKATLTWTSATGESWVVWTEEKLVRKEWSAPQWSIDWTTVATITTKDTYSSTGYEDTGLDSTKTYYYKVFAIYDNWTEKGSTDVNVTPEEYIPTVDTLLWYPLENNANDFSGHNQNLTPDSWVTFGLNGGVQCAMLNNNKITWNVSFLPQWWNPRTTSIWIFNQTAMPSGSKAIEFIQYGAPTQSQYRSMFYMNSTPPHKWYMATSYSWSLSWQPNDVGAWTLISNQRVNYTVTVENKNVKLYLNGELIWEKTFHSVNTQGTTMQLGGDFVWYLSNCIIEDKARTAQEIKNYYDGMKTKYGLS